VGLFKKYHSNYLNISFTDSTNLDRKALDIIEEVIAICRKRKKPSRSWLYQKAEELEKGRTDEELINIVKVIHKNQSKTYKYFKRYHTEYKKLSEEFWKKYKKIVFRIGNVWCTEDGKILDLDIQRKFSELYWKRKYWKDVYRCLINFENILYEIRKELSLRVLEELFI